MSLLLMILWICVIGYYAFTALNWKGTFQSAESSAKIWRIGFWSIGFGIAGFVCFVLALFFFRAPVLALLAAPVVMLGLLGWYVVTMPLTVVKADPPQVAVLTSWGKRLEVLLGEGEYLLFHFWPFKQDILTATAKTIPFEFIFDNVPCKSDTGENGKGVGAFVTVRAVGNIEADHMLADDDSRGDKASPEQGAKRIINFLNKGGNDGIDSSGNVVNWKSNGVLQTLEGIIGQGVREHAKSYTWEDYMGLKAPLAASLVAMISTARPRKLPRNDDGTVKKPDHLECTPEKYIALPEAIDEPLAYVCAARGTTDACAKEFRNRIIEMEFFLEMIREGGFADVPDLGIQFTRFVIPEIAVSGDVKKAADAAAAEKKQKEQEVADTDAQITLAKRYIEASKENGEAGMSLEQALEKVRLRANPGTSETIIRGSTSPLTDAAAILAAKR